MKLVIETLSKQYQPDYWDLWDFSIEFGPGILGLLAPNRAAKSTFMRILATITKPKEGKILWNDVDVVKSPDTLRDVLGYLPQDFGVYPTWIITCTKSLLCSFAAFPSSCAGLALFKRRNR